MLVDASNKNDAKTGLSANALIPGKLIVVPSSLCLLGTLVEQGATRQHGRYIYLVQDLEFPRVDANVVGS